MSEPGFGGVNKLVDHFEAIGQTQSKTERKVIVTQALKSVRERIVDRECIRAANDFDAITYKLYANAAICEDKKAILAFTDKYSVADAHFARLDLLKGAVVEYKCALRLAATRAASSM